MATGRDANRLGRVSEGAEGVDGSIRTHVADLTKPSELTTLASHSKRVDVLVHAAGVISMGTVDELSIDEFDRQYEVNLKAPFQLTQALLPSLQTAQGQVIFINSTAGLTAGAGAGPYAATKHGLKAIADSLREEVNDRGIRVTSVFIGRTATGMQAAIHKTEGKDYNPQLLLQPEDVAQIIIGILQLPRTAEVTEIRIRPMVKPGRIRDSGGL